LAIEDFFSQAASVCSGFKGVLGVLEGKLGDQFNQFLGDVARVKIEKIDLGIIEKNEGNFYL
jgi:hypothetical protein